MCWEVGLPGTCLLGTASLCLLCIPAVAPRVWPLAVDCPRDGRAIGGVGERDPQCDQWIWAGLGEVGMDDSQLDSLSPTRHPLPLGLSAIQREAVPQHEDCCHREVSSSLPGLGRGHGTKGEGIWSRACSLVGDASLACPCIQLGWPCWWGRAVAPPPLHSFSSTHLMLSGVLAQRLWVPGVGPHLNPFPVFALGSRTRWDACPVVCSL